jgi:hypothetical protein
MKLSTVAALALVGGWVALTAVLVLIGGPVAGGIAATPTLATLAMVLVGAVVAMRRPTNPLGWLFCCVGLGFIAEGVSAEYAMRALVIAPGSLPAGVFVAWLSGLFTYAVSGLVAYLLLLFPTGALPSRRWRPIAWLAAGAIGLATFAAAFRPGTLSAGARSTPGTQSVPALNPLGWSSLSGAVELAGQIGPPLLLLMIAASLLAQVRRFRAARGAEREQMKWFVFAAITSIAIVMASILASPSLPQTLRTAVSFIAFGVALAALPVGMGIALLRYRLYDIDVLINRTLVYGVTTGAIAAVFFGGIVVLQAVLRPFTGGSELAVAASTLLTVALFQPLRNRVQVAVDQRFYRSRYDAARTLDAFGAALRDEVDLDALRADLLDVVHETLRPAHAGVWLREAKR